MTLAELTLEARPRLSARARLQYDPVRDKQILLLPEGLLVLNETAAAIVEIVHRLANRGLRVVIAGLDLDYRGQPFGPMPLLMATAEFVTKMSAICTACGNPASRSQRIVKTPKEVTDAVLVGGEEAEALVGGIDADALAALGPPEVVVTFGSRGSLVVADGRATEVHARYVDVDPTGSGDAFAAAYLASRASGNAPATAARRATAVVAAMLNERLR